jgi:hypothetical protein
MISIPLLSNNNVNLCKYTIRLSNEITCIKKNKKVQPVGGLHFSNTTHYETLITHTKQNTMVKPLCTFVFTATKLQCE